MAAHFFQLGARLVLIGRNAGRLEKASEEIGSKERILTLSLDIRDANSVEDGIGKAIHRFGKIDGLVNNAAGNFLSPTENLSPNGFQAVINTVLNGTFHCTLSVGKRMIAQGGGAILNIVTGYAEKGASFVTPSAAAKAGVLNLTYSLAVEWAKYHIRLNAISPGPIPTKGAWKALMPTPEVEQAVLNGIPQKRFGKPIDLSNLACFLMSDMSSYITGACIPLDGGQSLSDNPFNTMALQAPETLKQYFRKS